MIIPGGHGWDCSPKPTKRWLVEQSTVLRPNSPDTLGVEVDVVAEVDHEDGVLVDDHVQDGLRLVLPRTGAKCDATWDDLQVTDVARLERGEMTPFMHASVSISQTMAESYSVAGISGTVIPSRSVRVPSARAGQPPPRGADR